MLVPRSLFSDEVIANKLIELQVKFLEEVIGMNSSSTHFIIENNQRWYSEAKTPEEQGKILQNVETIKKNQETRVRNADYYKVQIQFLQKMLEQKDGDIEINETIKELII